MKNKKPASTPGAVFVGEAPSSKPPSEPVWPFIAALACLGALVVVLILWQNARSDRDKAYYRFVVKERGLTD